MTERQKLTLAPALMLTLATSSNVEFNPLSAKRTARRCWVESGVRRLFAPNFRGMRQPVFVASVDGVGTKLKIAFAANKHDTVGADLVNHCVNDVAVLGARPLFFLDYIGTEKLESRVFSELLSGFSKACRAGQLRADRWRDSADAGNVSAAANTIWRVASSASSIAARSSMEARSELETWFSGCRRTDCTPMDIHSRGKSCSKD